MNITWKLTNDNGISQNYSSGLKYALLSEKYEQIGYLVFCKDFLQDVISGYLHNKKIDIYNFKYDPEIDPAPYLKKIRVLIASTSDKSMQEKIPKMLEVLHSIEDKLKISKTKVIKVENEPRAYKNRAFVLEGSRRWLISPPMISLYTLLIRIGMVGSIDEVLQEKVEPYQDEDHIQIRSAKDGLDRIIKEGHRKIFGADIRKNFYADTNALHNNCGIVAFSKRYAKEFFPSWY